MLIPLLLSHPSHPLFDYRFNIRFIIPMLTSLLAISYPPPNLFFYYSLPHFPTTPSPAFLLPPPSFPPTLPRVGMLDTGGLQDDGVCECFSAWQLHRGSARKSSCVG